MEKKIFLWSFSLVVSFSTLAGGGWPQKKNHGYFKLGQYVIIANQYYNPDGNIIRINPGISVYTTSIYGEYGLSDRLTAIVYFPFFTTSVLNALKKLNGELVEGDQLSSVGDTDVSFKYALTIDKPIALSAQLTLGLPFGNPLGGNTQFLQTGDGEFNQMLTFEASHSFHHAPFYVSSLLGFNNRTEGFSDELRFGLEAGFTYKKFTLIARILGVESLQNGDINPNSTQGVFGNNIEYLSFSPELIYSAKEKFGFSVSTGRAFLGSQVLASPSYSAGIFLKI